MATLTSVTKHFPKPKEGFITTLSSTISSGATSVPLTSVSGLTNGDVFVGLVEPGLANEQCFTGTVDTAGTQITNVVWTKGTNVGHNAGSTVVDYVTSTTVGMISKGILVEHNQNGTHSNITATTVTADQFIVNGATSEGWQTGLPAPNTVTYNGNRSYDLVFNSNDLTDTVSNGMRLKLARTVTPPTQCTDLEASSSQYWSKTSPAGISFTTTFTCAAWVKLESYGAVGGIIARRNASTEGWNLSVDATGQVRLTGLRIAANNKFITSYQSLPLNKWVHVAACLDMTVGDTTAQKIWIDGVEVPRAYTINGTATALVQGTTALVVGAEMSAGTNPFDGKIAQASVHSACLSDAQIKAMASQTISSSSPSIVSGFTFNGAATDVTANANDLTASGGAGYSTDSPFNSTEYGIITANSFSTNTTLTVQVPEGYAIPTSGGVSSVFYSTQHTPYGFPAQKGKWSVETVTATNYAQSSPVTSTWYNVGSQRLTVPVGSWRGSYFVNCYADNSATPSDVSVTLSTTSSSNTDGQMTTRAYLNAGTSIINHLTRGRYYEVDSQTTYYLLGMKNAGTLNNFTIYGTADSGNIRILFEFAYV